MPKPPTISRTTIVATALEIIDEQGFDAFSLGNLARRMNVRVPSFYYHFRDKSEILAEVARSILIAAEETMPPVSQDWKETLVRTGLEVRRSVLRHPNAAVLLLLYPPRYVVLGGYERSLRFMEKMGIPAPLRLEILAGLDYIAWGSMLFEAIARSHGVPTYPHYDPGKFPALATAMAAGDKDDEALYLEASYKFLAGYEKDGPLAPQERIDAA